MPTFYGGQDGHEFLCSRPEHSGIQHCAQVPDSRDQFSHAQCNLTLADWEQLTGELKSQMDRVVSCLFFPHRPSRLEVFSSLPIPIPTPTSTPYTHRHSTTTPVVSTNLTILSGAASISTSSSTTVTHPQTRATEAGTAGRASNIEDIMRVDCSATVPVATLHVRFLASTLAALNTSITSAPDTLRKLLLSDRPFAAEWRRTGGIVWNLTAPSSASASASATMNPLVECVNWNRYYVDCNASAKNPFMGATSFDNIGLAWVAIFQVISMEGWSDILYLLQDAFR